MAKWVIGILGEAGAGKDTAAQIIMKHTEGTTLVRMADTIKSLTRNAFLVDPDNRDTKEQSRPFTRHDYFAAAAYIRMYDPRLYAPFSVVFSRRKRLSPREIQQLLGTEVCRKVDADYFVNEAADKIASAPDGVVIPDIRFANEADLCDELWRIQRDTGTADEGDHSSAALAKDNTLKVVAIDNNGDIADLEREILKWL